MITFSKKQKLVYKIFFGLLGFSAVVTEMVVLIERGMFINVRFFSYFTIQISILVYFTLIASAVFLALGQQKRLDKIRGAAVTYSIVVGLGFALLLSHLSNVTFAAVAWDNIVLHYILPLAVLIDYLVDPPTQPLKWATVLTWLTYPLLYLGITLLRGLLTDWYPYPFLNVQNEGLGPVLAAVAGLFVTTVFVEFVVIALSRRTNGKSLIK